MKIAVVGAHGVGKTTLTKELAKHLDLQIVPDTAAEAFHKGWKVNEDTTVENQLWIMSKHIEYERELQDNFIADKALYDNYIYAQVIFNHDALIQVIKEVVLENGQYDLLIYLPIEFGIEADGRSTNVEFQKFIDAKYVEFLKSHNLKYHTVTGSVEERVSQALDIINSLKSSN